MTILTDIQIITEAYLTFSEGSSNKQYTLKLVKLADDTHGVYTAYGAIGKNPTVAYKNKAPLTLEAATKLYEKTKKEKISKGYQSVYERAADGAAIAAESAPLADTKKPTGLRPMLLNPIDSLARANYIASTDWIMQPKHDGERQMLRIDAQGIALSNRKGFHIPVPESVLALKDAMGAGGFSSLTIDCERMSDSDFIVFDLLEVNGLDLQSHSAIRRLAEMHKLSALFTSCLTGAEFAITETAVTPSEKQALYEKCYVNNEEGLVFKLAQAHYSAGRPASLGDALKLKFYETATVRVSAAHATKSSIAVELRNDTGAFVPVGNVTIPPNAETPAVGSLVEVRYLYAYEGGSLIQPTYLRQRQDLDETAATMSQLKYKKTYKAA